jgi:hypothetical protein
LFKGSRDLVDGAFLAQAGTTIADGTQITGGTSIGSACTIEAGVVIDGCIIGDKVVVGAGSHLSQCFVTHGTSIAPIRKNPEISFSKRRIIDFSLKTALFRHKSWKSLYLGVDSEGLHGCNSYLERRRFTMNPAPNDLRRFANANPPRRKFNWQAISPHCWTNYSTR